MMGLRVFGLCLIAACLGAQNCVAQGTSSPVIGDCIALEFVTSGCPQCRAMDQSVEESLRQGWAVRRVDVAADPFTAQRWRIHSTPTTLLIREGREVDRILGPVSFDELQRRMMSASSRIASNTQPVPTSASFSLQPINKSVAPTPHPVPTAMPSESQPNSRDASDLARRATVRIRVDEPNSQAVGTGTIIHSHQGEALVVTCGHLFRGIGQNPNIRVELFDDHQAIAYPANLIHFEAAEKDIGLISFRPDRAVACVPISSKIKNISEGDRVFSIGCDNGSDPSRRDSRVTKLNRYLGSPNIEVAGMPVQGRSGGGLFSDSGELIGVCYAADHELDEGLYTGLEVIHEKVAMLGLDPRKQPAPAIANQTPSRPSQSITLIVRDSDGGQRQLQIQDPSPALLQALAREGYAIAR